MGKGMGVTQSGPMEANKWARARVRAAGKVLEGDDKQTDRRSVNFVRYSKVINYKTETQQQSLYRASDNTYKK